MLRSMSFSANDDDNFWEEQVLSTIVETLTPRYRRRWDERLAPFFVAIGAAPTKATAPGEVIGVDDKTPSFAEWTLQLARNSLRDKAARAQRFNPSYLSEICGYGNRDAFLARLWEMNVETGGRLMYTVARDRQSRLIDLERRVGREQLLDTVNTWVWLELWLAYSGAQKTGISLDISAKLLEVVEYACQVRADYAASESASTS